MDPFRSARYSYGMLVISMLSALPYCLYLIAGLLAQVPLPGQSLHDLLHSNDVHTSSTGLIGFVALVGIILGVTRSLALLMARKRLIAACGSDGVMVVESVGLYAYAMPGPTQTIVVSRALTDALTDEELDVVLAHERAHVRLRHDRALLVGNLCVTFLPFMRPLVKRLEYALERIADEAAVRSCGNRNLVAGTLAKTVLFDQTPHVAMGISRTGVTGRVLSLCGSREPKSNVVEVMVPAALLVALSLAVVQWHHIVSATRVICGA